MTIEDKYLLIGRYEREIEMPSLHNSLNEAREAMKAAIIKAMDGSDDSIFAEYTIYEDYDWDSDSDCAWFSHRHGNSDWSIFSVSEILLSA